MWLKFLCNVWKLQHQTSCCGATETKDARGGSHLPLLSGAGKCSEVLGISHCPVWAPGAPALAGAAWAEPRSQAGVAGSHGEEAAGHHPGDLPAWKCLSQLGKGEEGEKGSDRKGSLCSAKMNVSYFCLAVALYSNYINYS